MGQMLYKRRELLEIVFCLNYARYFHHGTVGHNSFMATARLARESNNVLVQALVEAFDTENYRNGADIVSVAITRRPELFSPGE